MTLPTPSPTSSGSFSDKEEVDDDDDDDDDDDGDNYFEEHDSHDGAPATDGTSTPVPNVKFRPVVVLDKDSQRSPIKAAAAAAAESAAAAGLGVPDVGDEEHEHDILDATGAPNAATAAAASRKRRKNRGCAAAVRSGTHGDVLAALLDGFAAMCAGPTSGSEGCVACSSLADDNYCGGGGGDGDDDDTVATVVAVIPEEETTTYVGHHQQRRRAAAPGNNTRTRALSLDSRCQRKASGGATCCRADAQNDVSSSLSSMYATPRKPGRDEYDFPTAGAMPQVPFDLDESAIQVEHSPPRDGEGGRGSDGDSDGKNNRAARQRQDQDHQDDDDDDDDEDDDDDALLSPGHFFRPVSYDEDSLASAIRSR